MTRRKALKGVAGLVGGLAVNGFGAESSLAEALPHQVAQPDSTKRLGRPVSGYGERSPYEARVQRWQYQTPTDESSWTMSPLHDQRGIITPSSLHFERHHAGIPDIDPANHELFLFGMVERPLKLSVQDLMRFPAVSLTCFTECSGNTLTEWVEPTLADVQQTHGLISGTEWTGVLLSTLLGEAGLRSGATWIIAEGADGARMNRSIPLDEVGDDAMIAYGQNGEAVRPAQGYPMRLVLPGWEGSSNVKWLHVLKVTDQPYQNPRGDRQVHGLDGRWRSAPVHVRDGGEVGDQLPVRSVPRRGTRFRRDPGIGMERPRKGDTSGGEHGCRRNLAGGGTPGTGNIKVADDLSFSLDMGW